MSDRPSPYDLSAIGRRSTMRTRPTEGRAVVITGLQHHIAELEAEVERLKADGERLDALAAHANIEMTQLDGRAQWLHWDTADELRAELDAARGGK